MEVAQELGDVSICQVDSMSVYRGMDLATAKPTPQDRAVVPHYLVDLVDAECDFSVTDFVSHARAAMDDIAHQGRQALLVGGTGLYHRALIDGLTIPPQFPQVKDVLLQRLHTDGVAALYDELCATDPLAASRIEPGNERRVVRALEVTIGAGVPFSSFGPGLETYPKGGVTQVGIPFDPDRVDLAIAQRVDSWLHDGLLEEIRALLESPRGMSKTARQALGYKEFIEHLEGGLSLEAATELTIARTRRLARRQRSWFTRDPRIRWIRHDEEPSMVLKEVLLAERSQPRVGDAHA